MQTFLIKIKEFNIFNQIESSLQLPRVEPILKFHKTQQNTGTICKRSLDVDSVIENLRGDSNKSVWKSFSQRDFFTIPGFESILFPHDCLAWNIASKTSWDYYSISARPKKNIKLEKSKVGSFWIANPVNEVTDEVIIFAKPISRNPKSLQKIQFQFQGITDLYYDQQHVAVFSSKVGDYFDIFIQKLGNNSHLPLNIALRDQQRIALETICQKKFHIFKRNKRIKIIEVK